MSAVVDMMVKPILMIPPFFIFPPFSTAICFVVELIKGGGIEKIPGFGKILKYGRESILIIVLLTVLYIKAWQYIGPKLWHYLEHKKSGRVKPQLSGGGAAEEEPEESSFWDDVYDAAAYIPLVGFVEGAIEVGQSVGSVTEGWNYLIDWITWAPYGLADWCITTFLQIPIDIMSWNMESLSLDFDNLWGSRGNFFRGDCRRFINGEFAGDYSLYEKETIQDYSSKAYKGNFVDKYEHSPDKYLCTQGTYCKEMSDVFGGTMMGKNASLTKDKSPTIGFVNGINISSAPRKYAVCCDSVKGSAPAYKDCPKLCEERYPIPDLGNGNPFSNLITRENLKTFVHHPQNYIEEPIKAIVGFPDDFSAAKCLMHNWFYDTWHNLCTAKEHIKEDDNFLEKGLGFLHDVHDQMYSAVIPCPDGRIFSFEKKKEGDFNGCAKDLATIISDIAKNIDILKSRCRENCEKENDTVLRSRGCNSSDMEKAKRSALRNKNDVLLSQLPTDYENDKKKGRAIKKTTWRRGEVPIELNPNTEYNRGQQLIISASLTTENGTVCSRHDLSEAELDNCFGPFKPMTPTQYPVLFYKITKDFMGTTLWTLLGIFAFFIVLYILCLFNPIFREAYIINAGSTEGGSESMV